MDNLLKSHRCPICGILNFISVTLTAMSIGLKRYQQNGDLHAINFCCFRKRPILGTTQARDKFLEILEQTREKYRFQILGFVIMPDHVHLLLTEPDEKPLSTALQVLKQRFSRTRTETEVWEERYYDFNIYTRHKHIEKINYIHHNPVKRGLVTEPDQGSWSSARFYLRDESGPVGLTNLLEF